MYNVLLKKVKIALSLTSEEMLEVFDDGGIRVSKAELGALLRKKATKITNRAKRILLENS